MKRLVQLIFLGILFISTSAMAQLQGQDSTRRVITTAVPFLTITPDARAGAMGDAGVATSADANSVHWNPAKLAFIDTDIGFSLRHRADSNRCTSFCRAVPSHSATMP